MQIELSWIQGDMRGKAALALPQPARLTGACSKGGSRAGSLAPTALPAAQALHARSHLAALRQAYGPGLEAVQLVERAAHRHVGNEVEGLQGKVPRGLFGTSILCSLLL